MRWLVFVVVVAGCGSSESAAVPAGDGAPEALDDAANDDDVDSVAPSVDAALDAASDGTLDAMADAEPPGVRFIGRFDMTDPSAPRFAWSGSAVRARFTGTGLSVRLTGAANQFAVVIDGAAARVLKTTSGDNLYPLATALPAGVHEVLLHRRTEAFFGEVRFGGFEVDGGGLLAPPPSRERRIEIVGDSMTCGYGNEGKDQHCDFTADTENHFLTYGAIAARALDADLHAIAWSGLGMYRNYDGGTVGTMPERWGRTLPERATSIWDTTRYVPHAVVINLGTNDFAKGDPGTPFVNAYVAFVRRVRRAYPDAWIFPAVGSMLFGTSYTSAKNHLNRVIGTFAAEGDKKLALIEFPTQAAADGYGCDWHPNLTTNAKMAGVLESAVRSKLGW